MKWVLTPSKFAGILSKNQKHKAEEAFHWMYCSFCSSKDNKLS